MCIRDRAISIYGVISNAIKESSFFTLMYKNTIQENNGKCNSVLSGSVDVDKSGILIKDWCIK